MLDHGLYLFSSIYLTLVDITKLFSKVFVLIHNFGLLGVSPSIYIQKHLHTHKQSPTYNSSAYDFLTLQWYDFLTLQWCESVTHLVETGL